MIHIYIMGFLVTTTLALGAYTYWGTVIIPRRQPKIIYWSLRKAGYTNEQIRQEVESAPTIYEGRRKAILRLTELNQ